MIYVSAGASLLGKGSFQFCEMGVMSILLRVDAVVSKGWLQIIVFWGVWDDSGFCGPKFSSLSFCIWWSVGYIYSFYCIYGKSHSIWN